MASYKANIYEICFLISFEPQCPLDSGSCNVLLSASFKAGVQLNVVFPPLNMVLIEKSRSRLKQPRKSMLIIQFYVLECFVTFWVIFGYIWEKYLEISRFNVKSDLYKRPPSGL